VESSWDQLGLEAKLEDRVDSNQQQIQYSESPSTKNSGHVSNI